MRIMANWPGVALEAIAGQSSRSRHVLSAMRLWETIRADVKVALSA
jgi:hypothetical protein